MICRYCHKEIPDGSRFCLECGRRLTVDTPEVQKALDVLSAQKKGTETSDDMEDAFKPTANEPNAFTADEETSDPAPEEDQDYDFTPEEHGEVTRKPKLSGLVIIWIVVGVMIVAGCVLHFIFQKIAPAKKTEEPETTETAAVEETEEPEEVTVEETEEPAEETAEETEEPEVTAEPEETVEPEETAESTPETEELGEVTVEGFTTPPSGSYIQVLVDELDLVSENVLGWDHFLCYATKYNYYPVLQSYYDSSMNMTWYQLADHIWTLAPDDWLNIHLE